MPLRAYSLLSVFISHILYPEINEKIKKKTDKNISFDLNNNKFRTGFLVIQLISIYFLVNQGTNNTILDNIIKLFN